MKIEVVLVKVDDIEIGQCFMMEASNGNAEYWLKTSTSHPQSGFQCVELKRGHAIYIDMGTKVQKVDAVFRIHS